MRAVLRHQILEGLALGETRKGLLGYADLVEITQRPLALPDLVNQQPVAGYVVAHVLDVPLKVGDGGALIPKVDYHMGAASSFYEEPIASARERRLTVGASRRQEGLAYAGVSLLWIADGKDHLGFRVGVDYLPPEGRAREIHARAVSCEHLRLLGLTQESSLSSGLVLGMAHKLYRKVAGAGAEPLQRGLQRQRAGTLVSDADNLEHGNPPFGRW